MRKYMDVDITAALGAVMEINTAHYKSDFRYDKDMLMEAAAAPDGENNHLMWLSRPSGTECFREREIYLKDTAAYTTWQYHAQGQGPIRAYAVEVTGMVNGQAVGNLYELDYPQHARKVEQAALPTVEVDLKFAGGAQGRYSYEDYNQHWYGWQMEHGKIISSRPLPEDENALRQVLATAHGERQKHTPAVFKVRIQNRRPSLRTQLHAGQAATAARPLPVKEAAAKSDPSL